MLVSAWKDSLLSELPPRRPGEFAEKSTIGSRTRAFLASDSATVPDSIFKIYLVKTATMQGASKQLGWKPIPYFAEMAVPGTVFEGNWRDREIPGVSRRKVFAAANNYASKQLAIQKKYAEWSGLAILIDRISKLEVLLEQARNSGSCILAIGWGGGFVSKSAVMDTENPDYRRVLQAQPFYERAIRTGLPFPKTRRIVYENNQPATLAGWVELKLAD
jgi:CRISPR-associated protein Csm5